jgi:hypothetical protein
MFDDDDDDDGGDIANPVQDTMLQIVCIPTSVTPTSVCPSISSVFVG